MTTTESKHLTAINLGAGVQSSTLALMAATGKFETMPDVAIYADTGWDPPETYAMVEWFAASPLVPFEVAVVQASDLRIDLLEGRNSRGTGKIGFHAIPSHTVNEQGKHGQTRRQCTNEYKIQPIHREVRKRLGLKPYERAVTKARRMTAEQWLGISTDEVWRAKQPRPPDNVWITHRFPLLELGMSRTDCVEWWSENAPADAPQLRSSACLGCPYQGAKEWLRLTPAQIDNVEAVEQAIHRHDPGTERGQTAYLHRRLIPVREAIAADHAEREMSPSLFENECDAYCGL